MILLDTNVLSETRRPRPSPAVTEWFAHVDPASLYVSCVTLGELVTGAARLEPRNPAEAAILWRWIESVRLRYMNRFIDVDQVVAEQWGLMRAGRTLPVVDALIAATASVHGMTLATRNVRDFANLGIPLVNPWEG